MRRTFGASTIRSSTAATEEERLAEPYAYVKLHGGLVLVLSAAGELGPAREVGGRLLAFGRRSGHSRALALAHWGLTWNHLMSLDYARAAELARAGLAVAKDKLFGALNATVLAMALIAEARFDEARRVCDEWMPYYAANGNLWQGMHLSQVQACGTWCSATCPTACAGRSPVRSQCVTGAW